MSTADKASLGIPKKGGMLSEETEFALSHTTKSLVELSRYLLGELKPEYILLGKFQRDSLEACFGQFREWWKLQHLL